MAADISIEQAKAQQWILDVKTELVEIEKILNNVSNTLQDIPREGDDIINGIVATGQVMHDVWSQMCNGFKEATDSIMEGIDQIGKTAESVLDDINSIKRMLGT